MALGKSSSQHAMRARDVSEPDEAKQTTALQQMLPVSETFNDRPLWSGRQAVIIPLYGQQPTHLCGQLNDYLGFGLCIMLVQNNPRPSQGGAGWMDTDLRALLADNKNIECFWNDNKGGVAGGFNRGVERAVSRGAQWITLLDQDSQLSGDDLARLREPWNEMSSEMIMAGPTIWDGRRQRKHGHRRCKFHRGYILTRLLISSGTTFRAVDWQLLGPMHEWLVIDFVDHAWCFDAGSKGFLLLQHPEVMLLQSFGERHPNWLCRKLGMELYSPRRHFYSLRNLRWLIRQSNVPLDLKLKELIKMTVKPWLWLLYEPLRKENFKAILSALRAQLL